MNIVINEKIVRRNTRIAQVTMFGGLIVLAGGMFISFRMPQQFGLSLAALMVGFALSQIGIYFSNRWGRRPRPDELINQALKGLDSKYTIYHYHTPAPHLLVGPAGIWVLNPLHQKGIITFSNGRWRQKGGNLYLKIFAQEGLGRPDLEVVADIDKIQSYLLKMMPEETIPPIQAALIFTNERANVQVEENEEAPAVTLTLNKLKDFIRKAAKGKPISLDKALEIQQLITGE
jgi:hypothetical protein